MLIHCESCDGLFFSKDVDWSLFAEATLPEKGKPPMKPFKLVSTQCPCGEWTVVQVLPRWFKATVGETKITDGVLVMPERE